MSLGRYRESLQYGEQALRISQSDSRILQIVGESHYYLGNYLNALKALENYVAADPLGSLIDQVYYFMGLVFIEFEEFHHADIALTSALHFNDARADWWERLGFARAQLGDSARAIDAYNRALTLEPNNNAIEQAILELQNIVQ